jgi:FkbM family methyltransferase
VGITLHIKKALQKCGYDIKYYRPFYETLLASQDIKTVLDIGANDGHYTKESLERFPHATIHAFEPLDDCFVVLEELAKHESRVHAHHFALGAIAEERTITRSTFHPSSSLLPMSALHKTLYPKSVGGRDERIVVKRLDDIAPTLALREPMLVKIDVQGFEGNVIEGGKNTLKNADVVVVETSFFPLYEHQPLIGDIQQMLGDIGLRYYGALHTHYSKKTQRPMYEDSVFISEKVQERFMRDEL